MEIIDKTKILAVEGKDEISFFQALLRKLQIDDVQLLDFGGKGKFDLKIKAIPNITGFRNVVSFGLIRDADDNPAQSAFDSIAMSLKKSNLPVPKIINDFSDTNPKIGIFVMPNNKDSGMLEDLCLNSITDLPVNRCIDDFINCNNEKPKNESKSRIQCFLALQNPIANSLGLGALKGHWNFESTTFDDLKLFLQKM